MASNNNSPPQPKAGEGGFIRYTQGSDLLNAPSPPRRPDPPSSIESFPHYQPEPSFTAPPIPFPSPRLPDGSLPSLPGSQLTFFPNFPRYNGMKGSPLVNVTALNNTHGAFSVTPTPQGAGDTGGNGQPQQVTSLGPPQGNQEQQQRQQQPYPQQQQFRQTAPFPFGTFQSFQQQMDAADDRTPAASLPSATTFDFSAVTSLTNATMAPIDDPFSRGARGSDPNGSHASQLSNHSQQSSIATQEAFQLAFTAAQQQLSTQGGTPSPAPPAEEVATSLNRPRSRVVASAVPRLKHRSKQCSAVSLKQCALVEAVLTFLLRVLVAVSLRHRIGILVPLRLSLSRFSHSLLSRVNRIREESVVC